MGYTLKIGEATIRWASDSVGIDVPIVHLETAPAFGEPTDRENQRWPSYRSWADFVRDLGIADVMFNERNGGCGELELGDGSYITPLIDEHPGAAPVTVHHLRIVEEKLATYKAEHPTHRAEYPPLKPGIKQSDMHVEEDYESDPEFDPTLCRAEWLVFWMRYAIATCANPVFVNH